MRKSLLAIMLLMLAYLPAKAQFYTSGDDPGYLKWYSIQTPYYQIIYPSGADSLARVYGKLLEQFRVPIGRSIGITPGQGFKRKMPVILHTHNVYSNGSVGWAPRRMDLYTIPDPYNPDPIPWEIQLASHEPRHQAQFQWGRQRGLNKVLSWFSGEAWSPIAWQLYLDFPFGEGDAVAAETGLTGGTRARTADFLNYYRTSFDKGQFRSWEQWRFGSYRRFTPDHYALGYITIAGTRYIYKDPLLMQKALDRSRRNPLMISPYNYRKTAREASGKRFKEHFQEVMDTLNAIWQADNLARGPFLPEEQVTPSEKFVTNYNTPVWVNDEFIAVRSGYLHPSELVRIKKNGKVKRLRAFSSNTSDLFMDPVKDRMYWSETSAEGRWQLDGRSIVRYCDLKTGKFHDLTKGTRYFDPEVSRDGRFVAVSEYPVTGGVNVVVLSSDDGSVLRSTPAPAGIQPFEFSWFGEDLYFAGISAEGTGIYRISASGVWERVLEPSFQTICCTGEDDGYINWVSDRTGVNELYHYYPDSGQLFQITTTRYGGVDFAENGGYLYYVSQTLDGDMIMRTPVDSLKPREVNFADVCTYPVEDELTRQERSLGPAPDLSSAVPVSAPKRFHKLSGTRFHSWLPVYVNYDALKSESMDFSYETGSLGVSGFFQNSLGNFSGMLGYGLHQDPDFPERWRSSLHAKATLSLWYPVIEASFDLGDRNSRQYTPLILDDQGVSSVYTQMNIRDGEPLMAASVRAYIPLSYYKGGYLFGFVPQVRYSVSNDWFSRGPVYFTAPRGFEGVPRPARITGFGEGKDVMLQRLSASLRGYVMLSQAKSQPYPSWGIGMEGGISFRPGLDGLFTPSVYAYTYGYVPGFFRTQGLRLTGMFQHQLGRSGALFPESAVNIAPRGFTGTASSYIAQTFRSQWKITADYAIPFSFGDLSIPFVAYIKNFTLTPHADYTILGNGYNLWSVGADLTASLGRVLVLPLGAEIGVSFSYLGGNWYKNTGQDKPWSVSLILDWDLL